MIRSGCPCVAPAGPLSGYAAGEGEVNDRGWAAADASAAMSFNVGQVVYRMKALVTCPRGKVARSLVGRVGSVRFPIVVMEIEVAKKKTGSDRRRESKECRDRGLMQVVIVCAEEPEVCCCMPNVYCEEVGVVKGSSSRGFDSGTVADVYSRSGPGVTSWKEETVAVL